jgi:hypothetical protein
MNEATTLLVDVKDISTYAQIAINAREEMVYPYILAAQNLDVKPVLGNALMTDLLKNRTDVKYKTLLEGGEYVDANGDTVTFQGLTAAISLFSYARYMFTKNAVDTPFGMMSKTIENSTPTAPELVMSIASAKRNEGGAYLNECIEYIKQNLTTYTLYDTGCKINNTGNFIHKLTGASKI